MAIETKVEGKPEQITSLADWLTSSLEPAVSTSGDKLSSAKKNLGSEWQGETAEAIVSWLADAVSASDSLSTRIADIATALTTYNLVLSSVRTEAECVRNDATSGGLTVNGTVVGEPKDSSDATKTALYSSLSGRMSTANSTLSTAQQNLRTSLVPSDADRISLCNTIFGFVADLGMGSFKIYASRVIQNSIIEAGEAKVQQAARMQRSVTAASAEGKLSPAEVRAANAELNRANELAQEGARFKEVARNYEAAPRVSWFTDEIVDPAVSEAAGVTKQTSAVKAAGKFARGSSAALAVVGTGVGIYADMQSGESGWQAGVSNVSATATGLAVGFAIGSVVPGPGNVVGAAVGLAVGAVASVVTSTFTDGMVDSLFEDNKGVAHAAEKGVEAVGQLGKDIGSGIGSAIKGAGKLFGW